MPGASRIARTLEQLVGANLATGAQFYVSAGGELVASGTLGAGAPASPMGEETLHRLWCASKPLAGLAVLLLCSEGRLELDAPLDHYLAELPLQATVRRITIRQLLDHTAGLLDPLMAQTLLFPASRRQALLSSITPPPEWDPDACSAYSEVAAWLLVTRVIEAVAGQPAEQLVRARLLVPADAGDVRFRMTAAEYLACRERIGVHYACGGSDAPRPWLSDRTFHFASREADLVMGAYGTMRALARCYEWMLTARFDSSSVPSLVESARRGPRHDVLLGRRCEFSCGFMVNLEEHGFGPAIGRHAIGHVGWLGNSFAFLDPDRALAAAVMTNGVAEPHKIRRWRQAIIEAIYTEAG